MSLRRFHGDVLYSRHLVHRIRELELQYNVVQAAGKGGGIDGTGYYFHRPLLAIVVPFIDVPC